MHALITGGKGFIGSRLAQTLTQEGWEVEIMDLPFDVAKKADWKAKLKDTDYIFHLAAKLDDYSEVPEITEYIDTNVGSIGAMFQAILEMGRPVKIIAASSQSVYGEGINQKEGDPFHPMSIYGATKAAMETMLTALGGLYNIPVAILRYSIVLGAGQKYKDADPERSS